MNMNFQILKDSITLDSLKTMCNEMDRAIAELAPDLGRTAKTTHPVYRYKIKPYPTLYPAGHSWAQQMLDAHTDGETVALLAYVRQTKPTELHMDHSPNMGPGHTIILPLRDCEDQDSTIVFAVDGRSTDATQTAKDRLTELASYWSKQPRVTSDLINPLDIAHCHDWTNNLPLLGRFYYRLGDAVLFHGHLLHCSNNWSHNSSRKHRDYLLIHSQTKDSQSYTEQIY
jgi:hypothetical protein